MWRHIDVQTDWSFTYGRAPNAIDISQGSLTCPSYTDTGPTFLNGDSDTPPQLVAFYDTRGYGGRILILNPRRPHGGENLRKNTWQFLPHNQYFIIFRIKPRLGLQIPIQNMAIKLCWNVRMRINIRTFHVKT